MVFLILYLGVWILGIGGQEGMKLICGITVAEEKDRVGKEGKVIYF